VEADDSAPIELDPVVVVASKTPRPMSEVAGQVSVIDAVHIDQHLLEGLDDLLRYEPGLNTESSGTRFGVSGVNIRGIGGNRVALEVDGVPVRHGFATGSYSNGGQSLIETGLLKRLEVLHGPASSLYGSDALGGVMAFTTWDPDDFLSRGQGDRRYSLKAGFRDTDESSFINGVAAWASDAHGLMFAVNRREGHEKDYNNSSAGPEDPQDWESSSYFMRYTFDTENANRVRLSIEDFHRDASTQVNSILGFSRFRSTTALSGEDNDETRRLLVDYEFASEAWDRGVIRVFRAESDTRQLTFEERAAAQTPSRYERYFQYETRLDGLELNLFNDFALGRSQHRIGTGVELLRTVTEEFRDGFQQFLSDGSITKTVLGETLPVRDFPNSVVDEWGVFIQDEISLGNGWELIPALRWDRYDLDPEPDALYLEDYPGTEIVSVREDEISPRLGVIRKLDHGWSLYGQYVRGFRAPPHEDANIGLNIPVFKIRAIPNPDLRSETSDGYEVGIRQFNPSRRFSLAVFDTNYDDFIDSRAVAGIDPDSGYLLFQSRNISKARIRGIDMRLEQDLHVLGDRWSGLNFNAAFYWSEGDNLDNGQPLNSISPPQAVLGLAWVSDDQRVNAQFTGTFTRRQDKVDHSGGPLFEPPGYGLFDFSIGFKAARRLELRAGVRNLADRHYWRWSDVSRLAPNDPMLQLLSQPGRSYHISAQLQW
jgi:hemoglobin/transferrin/lactoferrin receptor protein